MRRLKAQLMGMFSGKSDLPPDSSYLPDSATSEKQDVSTMAFRRYMNEERLVVASGFRT